MTRTALYRHYDADGGLLYVGVSSSPARRMWEHRCRTDWAENTARSSVEWFQTRAAAFAAEAIAIADESPAYNVARQSRRDGEPHRDFIANTLGRSEMEARLGLRRGSVSMALGRGSFPANWFVVVRKMCAEAGIECPESAFAFKSDAEYSEPSQ